MLTNVFYYNIYQPYIMEKRAHPQQSAKSTLDRYAQNAQYSNNKAQVIKNNSIKRDVVDYVGAVCKNVTEMKDSAKYLSSNAEHYYLNVLNESLGTAKQWAEEDISMFVNSFNATVQFGSLQEHSRELKSYANELKEIVLSFKDSLSVAGIIVYANGESLDFNPNRIHDMDYLQFGQSVSGAARAAQAVYNRTSELLRMPAAAHMDFRQLSYYYNYRIDKADDARYKNPANLYAGIVLNRSI